MCRPHCFCYCIRLANDNPVIIGKKLLNIELFGEFEGALGLLQRLDAVEGIDAWLIILFALAELLHRYSKSFTYHGFIPKVEAAPLWKLW